MGRVERNEASELTRVIGVAVEVGVGGTGVGVEVEEGIGVLVGRSVLVGGSDVFVGGTATVEVALGKTLCVP